MPTATGMPIEPRELGQLERLVAGRDVARGATPATGPGTGPRRARRRTGPNRRATAGVAAHDRGRAGGVQLLDAPDDELVADGLAGTPRRAAPGPGRRAAAAMRSQHGVRIVVARLDALQVEDGDAAQAGQLAREPDVHDGVHGRGEDGDAEPQAGEVDGRCRPRRARRSPCPARARRHRSRRWAGWSRPWTARRGRVRGLLRLPGWYRSIDRHRRWSRSRWRVTWPSTDPALRRVYRRDSISPIEHRASDARHAGLASTTSGAAAAGLAGIVGAHPAAALRADPRRRIRWATRGRG